VVPYANNSDLPAQVRDALPDAAQSRFRAVVNSALARGLSDAKAFGSGWAVINNGWIKPVNGGKWVHKSATPRTLFASRPVENAKDVIDWAKGQGFPTTLVPEAMHVTQAYSKEPLQWPETLDNTVTVDGTAGRKVGSLGDQGAMVLHFDSPALSDRHQQLRDAGASSDYPLYQPHVTISWKADGVDPSKVTPYTGPIVLGPERFREIDPNWEQKAMEKAGARHNASDRKHVQSVHDSAVHLGADCPGMAKRDDLDDERFEKFDALTTINGAGEPASRASVIKVSDELGLVFGWAMICKDGGNDYFDVQDDHIPEDAMLKASAEFMLSRRVAKEMHFGDEMGTIVFAFPVTSDVAKAMNISTDRTGLMIAMKPSSEALLEKFRSGEYTGFSIGGQRLVDEEMAA
jgi:cation transport regulator ChaB